MNIGDQTWDTQPKLASLTSSALPQVASAVFFVPSFWLSDRESLWLQ